MKGSQVILWGGMALGAAALALPHLPTLKSQAEKQAERIKAAARRPLLSIASSTPFATRSN